MTTPLQHTSLGELGGYNPLLSTSLGELGGGVVPIVEEGGGSGGPTSRRSDQPHGSYIPTIRLPRDIDADTVYDDAELALLAVMLIEEFYE